MKITKQNICQTCNLVIKSSTIRKYCSSQCYFNWRKKNFKHTTESKKKISKSLIGNKRRRGKTPWIAGRINIWVLGEKNVNWKGDNVGYRALHRWIRKRKKGGNICEFCGKIKTTPKSIHLANKSKKYLRQLNDWIWLCVKCHRRFDHK